MHWARDGAEANAIVAGIARDHGSDEVIKVKSLATDEIGLNEALELRGIRAVETDLAELIVQLSARRRRRTSSSPRSTATARRSRALFERTIAQGQELGLEPPAIAEAARRHLREKFLSVPVAVSGANFGVAETGTIGVVESEGNGRMCTTLPEVLVTLMGIEKVLPEWRDLEVMLQLLPRSSTAERMNPYTSLWTGVRDGDGPREFHLVLLDAGRTDVLADEVGRQALHCIRCSACLNVCPVYARTGGHAYESVYPGPIGAILTPQLLGLERAPTLPWASTLCGACYEVCPVKIDIPSVLVHLRGRVVREVKGRWSPERLAMDAVARVFGAAAARYERAQRLARMRRGPLAAPAGPLGAWTAMRDLPDVPQETFREWWATRDETGERGLPDGPDADARRAARARSGGAARATRCSGGCARRSARGGVVPEVPRAYRQAGERAGDPGRARFCERAADYRATVRAGRGGRSRTAVAEACARARREAARGPARAPRRDDPRASSCSSTTRRSARRARRARRRALRLRARDRRDRHDRARRRRALAAAARSRSCPTYHVCLVEAADIVRRRARRDRRARPGGRRGPPDHARHRPERDLRHRARARRGRPRAAHARHPGRRVTRPRASLLVACRRSRCSLLAPGAPWPASPTRSPRRTTSTCTARTAASAGRGASRSPSQPRRAPLGTLWVRLWGNGVDRCRAPSVRITAVTGATAGAQAVNCTAVRSRSRCPSRPVGAAR